MVFFKRRADKGSYNNSSEDFIPVACHYDKHSLLTKNGQLLQIFQVNGINSERISKKLFSLREVVRQAIKKEVGEEKIAFWIHTIRRKANLDDDKEYNNLLSANLHEIWRKKNYWHDKFVNCLYVTVIYDSPELKLKNFNSLINSLFANTIIKFENNYFAKAAQKLNDIVDKLVIDLEEYGAVKLGIRTDNNGLFSDPMFLYRRIMQLSEEPCLLPISDISLALSSHNYAVGNDMIEVIDSNDDKKFAAIMSIREYQEVSSEALDQFLQIPVEMVATEVFYFVDKDEVLPLFKDQSYISNVSGDNELNNLKGLDKILTDEDDKNKFCHQQISFMVIGDDIKQLNNQVKQASEALAKIGIVHIREDVNLEKTFWAQLPGNFSFLSRMSPTILDNTAALASLHNFPTGNQYNPWGRAITLLRTEKGTPYFMNFHDTEGNSNICILGISKSGKTTLFNFLISEADKYKPTIIHIVDDSDSMLYTKAKGGRWVDNLKHFINPFLYLEDSNFDREFCFEFFKIISKHYFSPLNDLELNELKALSEKVFSIPLENRKLSLIIESLDESEVNKLLKVRLKDYLKDGIYHEIFEAQEKWSMKNGEIITVNLEQFDDKEYQKKFFPKEKKLVEEYEYNLNSMRSVKAGIVFFLQNLLTSKNYSDTKPLEKTDLELYPKIFAIDGMSAILNLEHYTFLIKKIAENLKNSNGVFMSTLNTQRLDELHSNNISIEFLDIIGTKIILPLEIKMQNLQSMLNLTNIELKKLESLNIASRMFLIKQDNKVIAVELSIGGLPGIIRLLSCSKAEIAIYDKLVSESGGASPEKWFPKMYDELENVL